MFNAKRNNVLAQAMITDKYVTCDLDLAQNKEKESINFETQNVSATLVDHSRVIEPIFEPNEY